MAEEGQGWVGRGRGMGVVDSGEREGKEQAAKQSARDEAQPGLISREASKLAFLGFSGPSQQRHILRKGGILLQNGPFWRGSGGSGRGVEIS